MKKILSVLLISIFLFSSMPTTIFAANEKAISAADTLYSLNLFNGTGMDEENKPIYEIHKAPTRHEAVALLVRLLGKTDEALNGNWNTPFNDVAKWAKPYVGYAYANKLVSGTSSTTFGGNEKVTAAQYITFVLRALGYQSGTDFQWNASWKLSDALGITNGQYNNNSKFTRGDAAVISEAALSANKKGSNERLIDVLLANGSVSNSAVLLNGYNKDTEKITVHFYPLTEDEENAYHKQSGPSRGNDEYDYYDINIDYFDKIIGNVSYMDYSLVDYRCKNLDDYIKQSVHMATMISTNQKDGYVAKQHVTQYGMQNETVVLLYSNKTTLRGFFVGTPTYHQKDNSYSIEITLCDYDFSHLYKQQKDNFGSANLLFINPEEIENSHATWIQPGIFVSAKETMLRQSRRLLECYSFWSGATTEKIGISNNHYFLAPIEELKETFLLTPDEYRYYLLLDVHKNIVGYTLF